MGSKKKKVIERSWISSAIQMQNSSELMRGEKMLHMELDKLLPIMSVFPVFNLPGSPSKKAVWPLTLWKAVNHLKLIPPQKKKKSHSCSNTRREVWGRASVGIPRGMVFPHSAAEWAGTCWGNICEINYKCDKFTWMDFRWAVRWNEAVLISRRVMWDVLVHLETNDGEKQMGNLQRIHSGTSYDLTLNYKLRNFSCLSCDFNIGHI